MSATRRGVCTLAALLLFLAPSMSGAQDLRSFLVNPAESEIRLDGTSALVLDLALPGGDLALPLTAQNGALSTPLRGVVLADLNLNPSFPGIEVVSRGTLVVPANGADALPGLPADPLSPAAAQLAATFMEGLFGITGTAALRDTQFSLSGQYSMEQLEPGRFAFPAVPQGFPPARYFVSVRDGFTDAGVPMLGLDGRWALAGAGSTPDFLGGGLVEDLGGGRMRLTIPLDVPIALESESVDVIAPFTIDLTLAGQIVAYSPALPAPEPRASALAAATLLVLALLRRRMRGRRG